MELKDGIVFEANSDGTYAITSYKGIAEEHNIEIPSEFNGSKVTCLKSNAFQNATIMSVSIPSSIVEIGDSCFAGCAYLAEVTFHEGSNVKKIGERVFEGTCLTKITIPRSLELIGNYCFSKCASLSGVVFEEGSCLTRIGYEAFMETSLTSVTIPKSVTVLERWCFFRCQSLSEVKFEDGSNLKEIRSEAFQGTSLKNITIPKSVVNIGNYCFFDCVSLSEVKFEEGSSLTKIGIEAFQGTSLTSITIPMSLEAIDEWCFSNCTSLAEIRFEEKNRLRNIGREAFRNSPNLCTAWIPRGAESKFKKLLFSGETGLDASKVKLETIPTAEIVEERKVVNDDEPWDSFIKDMEEYKEIRKLGSGGFGTVILVENDDRLFAAKFIRTTDDYNQTIFEREIQNLISLSHPFVIKFHGFCLPSLSNKDSFVILTEYCSCGSLHECIKDPPSWFDEKAKADIIIGIAEGMKYIHSKDIIHRDLKPANILLDENYRPRICDFGSSRQLSNEFTMTSAVGTTFYQAPEIYDATEYTAKVDVYSFGVMVYEIITETFAFRTFSPAQLMKHILLGERESMSDKISEFWRQLIEKCWAQTPQERPSFEEICSLLREYTDSLF